MLLNFVNSSDNLDNIIDDNKKRINKKEGKKKKINVQFFEYGFPMNNIQTIYGKYSYHFYGIKYLEFQI
jgi:hypothetical protein